MRCLAIAAAKGLAVVNQHISLPKQLYKMLWKLGRLDGCVNRRMRLAAVASSGGVWYHIAVFWA